MPGGRPYGFRLGDNAELLAEFIISRLAFTTKVPRTEDVGHDLLCSLAEKSGKLFKAGPFFTVQVKKVKEQIIYEKPHEIEWIMTQENPFIICISNLDSLSIELFSTWNMLNGFLYASAEKIILIPGNDPDSCKPPEIEDDKSEQRISLGKPILKITANEIVNDEKVSEYAAILKHWIEIDRENIVNKNAGMYWVIGPEEYETNKSINNQNAYRIAFYWNPNNLDRCKLNFGRCATALRVVIRRAYGVDRENDIKKSIEDLEQVLRSHKECLEPLAIQVLYDETGLHLTNQ